MTAEEAKAKWESRFWEAYDGAVQASSAPKEISDGEINNLSRVIDAIALDGFGVQVVEHVSDRMLRGLAFHEITQCDPIDDRRHDKAADTVEKLAKADWEKYGKENG